VRAKTSVCVPASGPGVSDTCAPLEIAVSPVAIISDTSKVAL
jgi:hypothetical protein